MTIIENSERSSTRNNLFKCDIRSSLAVFDLMLLTTMQPKIILCVALYHESVLTKCAGISKQRGGATLRLITRYYSLIDTHY